MPMLYFSSSVRVLLMGIPRLTAELAVHQVVEIVLLRRALEQERISRFEERARTGLWISQKLLLKVRKALCFQYGDPAFMLHNALPSG